MPVLTIQDLTIFTDLLIFFNNTYIQTSMNSRIKYTCENLTKLLKYYF